jgi:hypothetical protein
MELKEISLEKEETACCIYSIDDLPIDLPEDYKRLFVTCNGGNTSDDYFHFFGLCGQIRHNVIEWNEVELWKRFYGLDDASFVFVEDIFGGQYFFKRGRRKNAIYLLDPDDGKTYFMADNFKNFVQDVIEDSDDVFAEEKTIAKAFFSIPENERKCLHHLSYEIPIILGGRQGDIGNLALCDSLANITILGQINAQCKSIPPGTVIKDVEIDFQKLSVKLVL